MCLGESIKLDKPLISGAEVVLDSDSCSLSVATSAFNRLFSSSSFKFSLTRSSVKLSGL